jgi:hypothetical protein
MKSLTSIIALVLVLISCDYTNHKLILINQSSQPISYRESSDTILTTKNLAEYYLRIQIQPNDSVRAPILGKNGWDSLVVHSVNRKLNLFVFQVDTIKKYRDMQYVISKRLYRRYEYSLDYLNKHNWRVVIE